MRDYAGALALAVMFNLGDFIFRRIFSVLQRRKPPADRNAQRLECESSVSVWKSLDFYKSGLEKVLSALAIRSRIVVECRRNLDQPLQEHFFLIESLQPDFFPVFMRVVEVPGVERFKAFLEKTIFVVRIHEPTLLANARPVKSTAS